MHTDEEEIRDLVKAWHAASRAGDVDTVLSLMTEENGKWLLARDANLLGQSEVT